MTRRTNRTHRKHKKTKKRKRNKKKDIHKHILKKIVTTYEESVKYEFRVSLNA